jgi:hypothetical protein
MTTPKKLFLATLISASFLLPVQVSFGQGAAAKKEVAKAVAPAAASAQEIADAKAKGLVWVNTGTKVYHKDGRYYGTTKAGKFMTEADAQKAGFKAAQEGAVGKKKVEAKADAKAPAKK